MASPSTAGADAILAKAVGAYGAALGDRLLAAYALGSLAHGGFSASVSDVDPGLILVDPSQPRDGDAIEVIAATLRRVGSALAERLSMFWGTPSMLQDARAGGRFPPSHRVLLQCVTVIREFDHNPAAVAQVRGPYDEPACFEPLEQLRQATGAEQ